jgi:IS30 family transposase
MRDPLYVLVYKDCLSIRTIARLLKHAASAISHELYRNICKNRYLLDTAQQMKVV